MIGNSGQGPKYFILLMFSFVFLCAHAHNLLTDLLGSASLLDPWCFAYGESTETHVLVTYVMALGAHDTAECENLMSFPQFAAKIRFSVIFCHNKLVHDSYKCSDTFLLLYYY